MVDQQRVGRVLPRACFAFLACLTGSESLVGTAASAGQNADITIIKPSNTGVPGEEARVMTFDPRGNLWVFGRWPFWGEGGLAMLPIDELSYVQLPGGGFDSGAWRVWSNVDYPIPSVYVADVEFDAGGVAWIASQAGLSRFDRFAPASEQFFTYTMANAPFVVNGIRSMDFDAQGNLWLVNANVQSSNGALLQFNPVTEAWTKYTVGAELPWAPPWNAPGSVHVGASGTVYVNNEVLSGFAEFDGRTWTFHDGNGTLGTVRHYTDDGTLLERMNTYNSGLPDYFVDNIQRDASGNMWFATGEGGLSRMEGWDVAKDNPTRWRNWGNHNDLSEPNPWAGNEPMYSMYEDAGGFIWMGATSTVHGRWADTSPYASTYVSMMPHPASPCRVRWAAALRAAPEPDINGDGEVDGADLAILLGAWGNE
ncbi:MAG: hypothetical protein SGJ11_15595 [Phycisphaerae bacterium]|nr:hypothetical protein [Phycisphaerae bacterium]